MLTIWIVTALPSEFGPSEFMTPSVKRTNRCKCWVPNKTDVWRLWLLVTVRGITYSAMEIQSLEKCNHHHSSIILHLLIKGCLIKFNDEIKRTHNTIYNIMHSKSLFPSSTTKDFLKVPGSTIIVWASCWSLNFQLVNLRFHVLYRSDSLKIGKKQNAV